MRQVSALEIDGQSLSVSNLDKILYPEARFTKGQVIDYYIKVAEVLLPHLQNRPLTMKRYPNGVTAPFFYEKQCPSHRPDWVKVAPVRSEREDKTVHYCLINDLRALV